MGILVQSYSNILYNWILEPGSTPKESSKSNIQLIDKNMPLKIIKFVVNTDNLALEI